MNRVFLFGRLGRDPDLKFTATGTAICKFSMATETRSKEQKYVEWHDVTVWGKTGERCQEFLKKGSQVLIEGRIQNESWENRAGEKRSRKIIVAERVTFADRAPGENNSSEQRNDPGDQAKPAFWGAGDDDIPF